MQYRGRVIRKPFGRGSKSEHDAVMLVTDDAEFRLRRVGGNPFDDPVLAGLVGKTVEVEGTASEHTLLVTAWRALD